MEDLPPIDMTERLKEVNRALAEDSTPVESNRVTKLRFKEVIAEFQSPRDSDSDDGYGDSSDIMYDAEEENDIVCQTPKASTSLDKKVPDTNCDIFGKPTFISLPKSQAKEDIPSPIKESKSPETVKTFLPATNTIESNEIRPVSPDFNKPEAVKPILKHDDAVDSSEVEEEIVEEIIEEIPPVVSPASNILVGNSKSDSSGSNLLFYPNKEPLEQIKFIKPPEEFKPDKPLEQFKHNKPIEQLKPNKSVEQLKPNKSVEQLKPLEQNKFNKPFEHAKSNGRFSKSYKKGKLDYSEFEETDDEDDEICDSIFGRKDSSERESENSFYKYDDINANSGSKPKHKTHSQLENNKLLDDVNNTSNLTSQLNKLGLNKLSDEDRLESYDDKRRTSYKLRISDHSPPKATKSPNKNNQLIPNIKSSLMSPQQLPFNSLKNTKGPRAVQSAGSVIPTKTSRSRRTSDCSPPSPTKTLPTNPVRTTRPHSSRKGSPLPRRSTKFNEKTPLKAIHDPSVGVPNFVDQRTHEKNLFPKPLGVKKAASTSDLHRRVYDEHKHMNEEVFERWLKEKNRNAAISKKQKEEAKAVEEMKAAAKLEERRRLAEEAFQQWLRRKREQLKAEKRMRAQQRKLDQQSTYARTRIQCDDAYKEWCARKQEEMVERRGSGLSNVRSRSLERTWIQEKNRKLYTAYLPRH